MIICLQCRKKLIGSRLQKASLTDDESAIFTFPCEVWKCPGCGVEIAQKVGAFEFVRESVTTKLDDIAEGLAFEEEGL